jgi:multidrug efflux pump subunit AcrA (membrane-fusion protein)
LLLLGGLAVGVWRHYALHIEVTAAAEQHRDFVPSVRVEAVRASANTMSVTLPATTNAFKAANIYARASGYITLRNVDIGSLVKAGDLLAAITAPELDHQIAQAEASLAQAKASRRQTKANRELARVTWGRDSVLVRQGWATQQQATPIAWAMRLSSRPNRLMTPPSGRRRPSCWCCASRRPISRSSPRSMAS